MFITSELLPSSPDEWERRRMANTIRLRGRRQLTLPKEVADAVLLEEGAELEVELRDDGIFMRPRIVVDQLDVDDEFVREVIRSTRDGYESLAADPDAQDELRREYALFDGAASDGLDEA
jgi:bifunctional DNA-binding transcriptional regulator/antitoxin component of YhaV-PrlF toxin-antitoxin module